MTRSALAMMAVALAWTTTAVSSQIPALSGSAKDELAGNLRGLLLKNLPTPLYEAKGDWGHQSKGKKLLLRGKLLDISGEFIHEAKNDGLWQKIRVDAINPNESLVLDLRNIVNQGPGRLTFQIYAALDTHFDYQRQRWLLGVKVLDAKARARARVKVTLDCDATSRIETKQVLPELVVQLKVTKADVRYDNLQFEHIAGVGGDGAKVIGELVHDAVNQWRPTLERDLLDKANAAIVKAGENKEVRLSLNKLFKSSKAGGE